MDKNVEYITIKEFAKRAGVSVQSVYKRLNGLNNPLNQFIQLVDNQKMLDIRALQEIYGIEVEQPIQPNHSTYSTLDSTPGEVQDEEKKVLVEQIETLKKELDAKNEQIEKLLCLVDQAQRLQGIAEQKILALEQKEMAAEQTPEQKSWWQFWK